MPTLPRDKKEWDTFHERIGWRIKIIRKARGLRQPQLAAPGLSKSFISLLETNRSRASVKTLVTIAYRLGVAVAVLVGEQEQLDGVIAHLERLLQHKRAVKKMGKRKLEQFGLGGYTRGQITEWLDRQITKALNRIG